METHKLVYNIHSCKISWCPICKEHFYPLHGEEYHLINTQHEEAKIWFDNHSDCYAEVDPEICIPVMSKEIFLKYISQEYHPNVEYQHIKSSRIYKVISMSVINATNADDGKIMVLYEGMKRDGSGVGIFVRDYNEFIEKFKEYNTTK